MGMSLQQPKYMCKIADAIINTSKYLVVCIFLAGLLYLIPCSRVAT